MPVGGCCGAEGKKGEKKMGHCNSIINKMYFKKESFLYNHRLCYHKVCNEVQNIHPVITEEHPGNPAFRQDWGHGTAEGTAFKTHYKRKAKS